MDDDHTTLSAPWDVYNCSNTEKNPFQLNVPIFKPVEGDFSDSFFLGYSSESHLIAGCHFSVGFDVNEFFGSLSE